MYPPRRCAYILVLASFFLPKTHIEPIMYTFFITFIVIPFTSPFSVLLRTLFCIYYFASPMGTRNGSQGDRYKTKANIDF